MHPNVSCVIYCLIRRIKKYVISFSGSWKVSTVTSHVKYFILNTMTIIIYVLPKQGNFVDKKNKKSVNNYTRI